MLGNPQLLDDGARRWAAVPSLTLWPEGPQLLVDLAASLDECAFGPKDPVFRQDYRARSSHNRSPKGGGDRMVDEVTSEATPDPWWREERVGRLLGIGTFLAAALLLYLCVTRWDRWVGAARHQRTDDAYLQTDLTPLGARVSGYVRSVPAQDFQPVRAGQLLVQIDDDDYRAAAAQADANEAVASAAIGNLVDQAALQQANIAAAGASVAAARATSDRALKAARRQHVLLSGGAGSQDAVEAADAAEQSAAADLARADAGREGAVRQLAVIRSQTSQAKAALAAAKASAEIAHINLRHTRIVAPADGVLGQRQVRPGQYIAVGSQVVAFAPLPTVWIVANYKETQLARMRVGQRAVITVDSFPGHKMLGHVAAFAPASGSQFALLPPDNATGNFTKIVQRIGVKILIDDPDGLGGSLRAGMSVVTDVDTSDR
jgi:membrane fusion protein, multidrug efflux system